LAFSLSAVAVVGGAMPCDVSLLLARLSCPCCTRRWVARYNIASPGSMSLASSEEGVSESVAVPVSARSGVLWTR
jgi:hypothetical protein